LLEKRKRLFNHLEFTGIHNPAALVAELVDVKATEIIIVEGNGEFGTCYPQFGHFSPDEIIHLEGKGLINCFVKIEVDIVGGRVGIKMSNLGINQGIIRRIVNNIAADGKGKNK